MVIIRLDQCMPEAAVRSVLHTIQRFQCRVDRFTKLGHYYKLIQLEDFLFVCLAAVAEHLIAVHLYDSIDIADVPGLQCDLGVDTNRHVIKRRAFRQVFLKHEPELFLLHQFIGFLQNPVPECGIIDLLDQVL